MNLYLDTSALVKLYLAEPGSGHVKAAWENADVVYASTLAYVEAHSAFARKYHQRELSLSLYLEAIGYFNTEWENYYIIKVDDAIVKNAAALTERRALRALDALHLASAKTLGEIANIPMTFLGADQHLILAAKAEGLEAVLVEM